MAVDCAVMVLDAAKGVEAQTRRLFEVCRLRQTPILTFINKFDQPGRASHRTARRDRADADRSRLIPLNWPIGTGPSSRACYDHGTIRCSVRADVEGTARADGGPRSSTATRSRGDRGRRCRGAARDIALLGGTLPAYDGRLPGRPSDAGVLRQRAARLRHRAVSRGARQPGAAAAGRGYGRWQHCPARGAVFGVRVQDPGEHGSVQHRDAWRSCGSARAGSRRT